ncbi:MAG: hypothetical protein L0338_30550 [Acidobacteria bacterium]|nr:hypothetical protein [Acidobacteriota bacterium]
MIPFDLSVSFVAGQTLAFSAKRQLAGEPNFFVNKPLMISLLWMSLIYAPSAMFFYHGWTAWNSVYVFKDVPVGAQFPEYPAFETNRLLYEAILIWVDCTALVALFWGAFVLAHRWIASGKTRKIAIACATVTLALLIYMGLTYDRSFVVTTYERWEEFTRHGISFWDLLSWRGVHGSSFLGHSVFWANVVIAFIDFGPLIYLYRRFANEP